MHFAEMFYAMVAPPVAYVAAFVFLEGFKLWQEKMYFVLAFIWSFAAGLMWLSCKFVDVTVKSSWPEAGLGLVISSALCAIFYVMWGAKVYAIARLDAEDPL